MTQFSLNDQMETEESIDTELNMLLKTISLI